MRYDIPREEAERLLGPMNLPMGSLSPGQHCFAVVAISADEEPWMAVGIPKAQVSHRTSHGTFGQRDVRHEVELEGFEENSHGWGDSPWAAIKPVLEELLADEGAWYSGGQAALGAGDGDH